jgi:hypothetical protein
VKLPDSAEVQHVQTVAAKVMEDAPGTPDWDVLASLHRCGESTNEHELVALCLRLALDEAEKANEVLRESMEDLVRETDEIKAKAEHVFVMGPGVK